METLPPQESFPYLGVCIIASMNLSVTFWFFMFQLLTKSMAEGNEEGVGNAKINDIDPHLNPDYFSPV